MVKLPFKKLDKKIKNKKIIYNSSYPFGGPPFFTPSGTLFEILFSKKTEN